MNLFEKKLIVTMPDRSRWSVPVGVIAKHRAKYYAHDFDGDAERSLLRDTVPLFSSDEQEIVYWASNHMSWKDVMWHATLETPGTTINYQEGWVNGEKEIVDD